LQKETQQLLSTSKTLTAKEGIIKEPGWGRVYSISDHTGTINGKIVVDKLNNYFSLITNSSFLKLVEEISDAYDKISTSVGKSNLISDDTETTKLNKLVSEVNKLSEKFNKFVKPNFNNKTDSDFDCLTKQEIDKVLNLTSDILKNKQFEKVFNELNKSAWEAYSKISDNSAVRLSGGYADDIRKANMLMEILQSAVNEIYDLYAVTNKLCYANIQYVKRSIQ
jgi:hypothetical protein